jgi:hypothetical protein
MLHRKKTHQPFSCARALLRAKNRDARPERNDRRQQIVMSNLPVEIT